MNINIRANQLGDDESEAEIYLNEIQRKKVILEAYKMASKMEQCTEISKRVDDRLVDMKDLKCAKWTLKITPKCDIKYDNSLVMEMHTMTGTYYSYEFDKKVISESDFQEILTDEFFSINISRFAMLIVNSFTN